MCMGENTQVGGITLLGCFNSHLDIGNSTAVCFGSQKWKGRTAQSLVQWDNSNRNEEPTT